MSRSPSVLLSFDDTVASQFDFVAPLLKKRGWNATFFITFFSDEWQGQHGETMFKVSEMQQLAAAGFELGNHTLNHVRPDTAAAWESQITLLEDFFAASKLPAATSFAYPGGPYNSDAADVLKAHGYHCARSVRHEPWHVSADDPFNLPAYAISEDKPEAFAAALNELRNGESVIFCYHGVPDRVHPWCNVEQETFVEQMRLIAEVTDDVRALNEAY